MNRTHKLDWRKDELGFNFWTAQTAIGPCILTPEGKERYACGLNMSNLKDETGQSRLFDSPDDAADYLEVWLLEQAKGLVELLKRRSQKLVPIVKVKKACPICGTEFLPLKKSQLYDKPSCGQRARFKRWSDGKSGGETRMPLL